MCNSKFYIGVHKTKTPDKFDKYIGGGIISDNYAKYLYNKLKAQGKKMPFISAVVKYGYSNFRRTVIEVFDTEKEAYDLEAKLVTETLVKSKYCYNSTLGGKITCRKEVKIYQFAPNGNFIRSYKSIQLAADMNNIDQANICAVLRGDQILSGGYY